MKRFFIINAVSFLLLLFYPFVTLSQSQLAGGQDEKKEWKIVYLADGKNRFNEQIYNALLKELALIAEKRYKFKFQVVAHEYADWNPVRMKSLFNAALADTDVDMIIGAGYFFAVTARDAIPFKKPVVVASVLNAELLDMPYKDGTSGEPNLYYVTGAYDFSKDISAFQHLVPFRTVHIVLHPNYIDDVKQLVKAAGRVEYKVEFIPLAPTIPEILQSIDSRKVEALMITPMVFSYDNNQALIDGLIERKIPSYTIYEHAFVEKGILAARVPKVVTRISRRVAISINRIFQGEDAGSLPVLVEFDEKLVINQQTARTIGAAIPFDVMLDADILFPYAVAEGGEMLTVHSAVNAALESNWNFKILDEQIKSAQKDHLLQWTNYLPSVIGRLTYDIVDSETARHSRGASPKRNFRYGVSLNQLIFSDPVIRDIMNTGKQVRIEKHQRETTVLDITELTVNAYLAFLRRKSLYQVALSNLRAIENSLKTAQNRHKAGIAGKEEVLRWESEHADTKSRLIRRAARVQQARVTLNQLMNNTLDERFVEQDVSLELLTYFTKSSDLEPYIRDEEALQVFLTMTTSEAFENSPELAALMLAIQQQKNEVWKAGGKFVFPEAELNGDLGHKIYDKFYSPYPTNDHPDWEVGLRVTYPLFDRGSRPVDFLKQRNELHRVQFKKELKAQEIASDLRRAAYDLFSSIPTIKLSNQAMVSSTENYKIMEKKYAEGTATITDLINARNDKFQREGKAVISIYNFLTDLALFNRTLAHFYMLAPDEERKEWLRRIQTYMESAGVL